MAAHPRHWEKYYLSTGAQQLLDQQYSLSDRVRYYWPVPAVEEALSRLFANLKRAPPPLTLLSQFMPQQYAAVRAGSLDQDAHELALHGVDLVLQQYASACGSA